MEAQLNSLIDAVRQAVADGRVLRLRGGGSKDFWGQSLTGEVLDTRAYAGIVSYEPSELVVTVRCGTPLAELEAALVEAKSAPRTTVIVIDTDPMISTDAGGHWWEVAVPEVSARPQVNAARKNYEAALAKQRVGD